MKIDFIISGLSGGGAERVMILLANAFSDRGIDTGIITFNGEDDFGPKDKVRRIRLHHGRLKNHTLRSIWNLFNHYRKKKNRPDIVISFLPSISFVALLVAKLFGIKIIVSEHINYLQENSRIDKFTREKLYRFADYTTVLTNFDVAYYKKYGAKVVVMPNPISFDILKKENSKKEKVILAVGSLDRYFHKGFDNLIEIVSPVLKAHPNWKLKIVGKGDLGLHLLQKLVIEHEIEPFVEFTGFSTNVSQIMRDSEIFILTSRFEGLPMVLIEAMSQRMACIAYDCVTGPGDIIRDREDGLLITDQDKEAMALGLEELIEKTELRRFISENAAVNVDRFEIDKIIDKWEQLIYDH